MLRRTAQLALLVLMVAATVLSAAPAALADAAGPTDYNTEIVSIEPFSGSFRVEMIGGDSFIQLEQVQSVEIIVLGYESEPYLRFAPDGTVYENRRSPAVWVNQDRYGDAERPAFASADARPEWTAVASNGIYSWHDHRSHWMNEQPKPGIEPGDFVFEGYIPLLVDDDRVEVTVAVYWLKGPSVLPVVFGFVAALVFVAVSSRLGRASRALGPLVAAVGAAALGVIAFGSVPTETEPSQLLWLLPVLAIACLVVMFLARDRTATTVYLDGLAVAAAATLGGWAWFRKDALQRALIPSDAPPWLDRFVITAALVIAAALLVQGVIGLLRPQRLLLIDDDA